MFSRAPPSATPTRLTGGCPGSPGHRRATPRRRTADRRRSRRRGRSPSRVEAGEGCTSRRSCACSWPAGYDDVEPRCGPLSLNLFPSSTCQGRARRACRPGALRWWMVPSAVAPRVLASRRTAGRLLWPVSPVIATRAAHRPRMRPWGVPPPSPPTCPENGSNHPREGGCSTGLGTPQRAGGSTGMQPFVRSSPSSYVCLGSRQGVRWLGSRFRAAGAHGSGVSSAT